MIYFCMHIDTKPAVLVEWRIFMSYIEQKIHVFSAQSHFLVIFITAYYSKFAVTHVCLISVFLNACTGVHV